MSGVLSLLPGVVGAGASLAVTANNVTRVETGFAGSGLVTTNQSPNTVVTGGIAPYTYAWARVSGSTVPAVSSATVATPSWSGVCASEVEEAAVWRVTVTDAAAAEATADITISLNWFNLA